MITFEYPPFFYTDNGVPRGYAVDLLQQLQQLNPDHPFQIIFHPLSRARQELDNGTYLVGLGTRNHHIEAIKQGRILPIQIGTSKFVFFYHKPNLKKIPNHTSLAEFKPYRICAQRDSAAGELFKKHGIEIDPSNDLPSLFRKVAANRCDLGLAVDVAIYTHFAQDPKAAEFGIVNFTVFDIIGDILINSQHKDAQKLLKEWTLAIEKMQQDGSLLKLAEKNFVGGKVPEGFLKFGRKE